MCFFTVLGAGAYVLSVGAFASPDLERLGTSLRFVVIPCYGCLIIEASLGIVPLEMYHLTVNTQWP